MFFGSIAARPLRSLLSVIAIAIQVILVLMIVGLTSGVISEWGKRVEGVGADILVQPPNSSIFFAFSSAVMQESVGDQIAALPGVDEVAPTVILTEPKNLMMIYGIDYQRFNALSRGFLYRAGRPFAAPDEAIADDIIARSVSLEGGQPGRPVESYVYGQWNRCPRQGRALFYSPPHRPRHCRRRKPCLHVLRQQQRRYRSHARANS